MSDHEITREDVKVKSRVLLWVCTNCTGNSAFRAWEGSCSSLMSKTSPVKERFAFFSKPHFWAAHLWVWPSLIKHAILTTKTLKETLIFPLCCFFSSVLGAPSPSSLPISLNSCLVRRGGNTWAGFACSGWLVAFMPQPWLGASSHITVICAFDFLHHHTTPNPCRGRDSSYTSQHKYKQIPEVLAEGLINGLHDWVMDTKAANRTGWGCFPSKAWNTSLELHCWSLTLNLNVSSFGEKIDWDYIAEIDPVVKNKQL